MPTFNEQIAVKISGQDVLSQPLKRIDTAFGGLRRSLTSVQSRIGLAGTAFNGFGTRLSSLGNQLQENQFALTAAAGGLALLGKNFVDTAADAEETRNRFRAVFKEQTDIVQEYVEQVSANLGRAKTEVQDSLSSFQGFAVGLGFAEDKAAEFSTRLNDLSLDFASFNNLSDNEAVSRFVSGLSGSAEVFDRFGINLKQTNLDLKLQELGFNSVSKGASEMEKAIARLAIIEESLGAQGAIGDAIRTTDTFVGSSKRLRGQITELREALGEQLIPVFAPIVSGLANAVKNFNNLSDTTKQAVAIIGLAVTGLLAMGAVLPIVAQSMTVLKLATTGLSVSLSAIPKTLLFLNTLFFGTASSAGVATVGVTGLQAALATLALPITLIIAALGALFVAWQRNFLGIRDLTSEGFRAISNIFQASGEDQLKIVSTTLLGLGNIFGAFFKDLLSNIVVALKRGFELFSAFGENIGGAVFTAVNFMGQQFGRLKDFLGDIDFLQATIDIGNSLIRGFQDVGTKLVSVGKRLGSALFDALRGDFSGFSLTDLLFTDDGTGIDARIQDFASSDLAADLENLQKDVADSFGEILGAEEFGLTNTQAAIANLTNDLGQISDGIEAALPKDGDILVDFRLKLKETGGGFGDEAFEEIIDQAREALSQADFDKLSSEFAPSGGGTIDLKDLLPEITGGEGGAIDGATKKVEDFSDKIRTLVGRYDTLSSQASRSLEKLKDDHDKNVNQINQKIEDLQESLSDLTSEYENNIAGIDSSIGEKFVEQEQKIADIRKQIRDDQASGESTTALQEELKKEEAALKEFTDTYLKENKAVQDARKQLADLEATLGRTSRFDENSGQRDDLNKQIADKEAEIAALIEAENNFTDEVSEARRRASITDFERFQEDAEKRRQTITEDFQNKKEEIEADIELQKTALEEEQQIFELKREEYQRTADKVEEMRDTFVRAMGNIETRTKTTVKIAQEELAKLRAALQEIKSLTAPAEGPDNRTLEEVGQAFVKTPAFTGNIFSPLESVQAPSSQGGGSNQTSNTNLNFTIQITEANLSTSDSREQIANDIIDQLARESRRITQTQ